MFTCSYCWSTKHHCLIIAASQASAPENACNGGWQLLAVAGALQPRHAAACACLNSLPMGLTSVVASCPDCMTSGITMVLLCHVSMWDQEHKPSPAKTNLSYRHARKDCTCGYGFDQVQLQRVPATHHCNVWLTYHHRRAPCKPCSGLTLLSGRTACPLLLPVVAHPNSLHC